MHAYGALLLSMLLWLLLQMHLHVCVLQCT
jgi:hypothetical protein